MNQHTTQQKAAAPILSDSGNLDLLRTLAVLFVVFSHLPIAAPISSLIFGAGNYHSSALGLLGVGIFFVHTCLVLMLSLERQSAKEGTYRRALTFFIRRAFRIYPLSITTVITLAVVAYLFSDAPPTLWTTVSNILLIQNITGHPSNPGALWSLPYEVQMYLFLPALYVMVNRLGAKAPRYVSLLWFGTIGLVLAAWALGLNYHLIKYFPAFIPGVLAFSLRGLRPQAPSELMFMYIFVMVVAFPILVAHGIKENLLLWPVCMLLGFIIPYSREVKSILLRRVGKTIARYSYGIYLVHGPCIIFAFHYLKSVHWSIQWLIFISGVFLLSYLAFHLIEKPGISFGVKLAKSARHLCLNRLRSNKNEA